MQYRYKGIDRQGRKVSGTLSAATQQEAKAWLKQEGIYLTGLLARPERERWRKLLSRQMPMVQLSDFSRELSSYLNSGMTVLTALKLMESQHRDEKRYVAFLGEIRRKVEEGASLYKALADQEIYRLPDFFLQSLRVAGERGKVSEVLTNMGQFFSLQNRIRKQVASAMAYPLFIFVVALGMTGFLISFVVPKITGIFEDTGQKLPGITRFVLELSDFFTRHSIALIVSLVLLVVLWKVLYRLWDGFRYRMDAWMLKSPVIGTLIQNHELARFSYILSLMLDSGVSYAQAVQLAGSTFGNEALRRRFAAATAKVVEGNKLSNALQISGGIALKRNFLQSLALGEESSEVASVMRNVSRLYSEENEDRIKMLLSLLEPAMMLLIGAIVGVIVMAMLLPIFSMSLGAKI